MTFSVPGYCIIFSSHVSLGSPWLSKVDILGSGLSGASLKIWGAQCGVQSLCSSGRSWGFRFLLHSGLPHQGWGYSKIVSQPLLPATMWFFSSFARCVWVIHLVFLFCFVFDFFRGNCFIYSCRFSVAIGGGEFSVFLLSLSQTWNLNLKFFIGNSL